MDIVQGAKTIEELTEPTINMGQVENIMITPKYLKSHWSLTIVLCCKTKNKYKPNHLSDFEMQFNDKEGEYSFIMVAIVGT